MTAHTFHTIEKVVESELTWLWLNSYCDLGERSNWNAMVNVKVQGGSEWKDNFNEGIMTALDKKRRIETKLSKLTTLQQQILFAQFGSYKTTYYFTSTMLTSELERQKYIFIYKFFQGLSSTAVLLSGMPIEQLNKLCSKSARDKVQTAYAISHLKQECQITYKETIMSYYRSAQRKNKKYV